MARKPVKDTARQQVCFFICSIGSEGSPERRRGDDVFDFVVKPAAEECGLTAVRADKIEESGSITSQIVDHLIRADIVIADFWGNNPNVFYELAVRHARKKPVIHLYLDDIPFDVGQMRAVKLDHFNVRSVYQARTTVTAQMKVAMQPGFEQWTPIGVTLDLEMLRTSESEVERRIGEMYSMLESLIQRVQELSRHIPELPRTRASETFPTSSPIWPAQESSISPLGQRLIEILASEDWALVGRAPKKQEKQTRSRRTKRS